MKQRLFKWGALVSGGLAVALLCFFVATMYWFIIPSWQSSDASNPAYAQMWIGMGGVRLEVATGPYAVPLVDPPPSVGLNMQIVRSHFFPSMLDGGKKEYAGFALGRTTTQLGGGGSHTIIEVPLFPAFFVAMIWPVIWVVYEYRAERLAQRRREHLCVTCGYDLRGSPIVGPCPECGQAHGDSQESAAGPSKPSSRSRNISS